MYVINNLANTKKKTNIIFVSYTVYKCKGGLIYWMQFVFI